MKYTDEAADEIISRFKLSPTTKRVWKNRGIIPDQYAAENYKVPTAATTAQTAAAMRVFREAKEVIWTAIQKPKFHVLNDVNVGKNALHDNDYRLLLETVTELRNSLRAFATNPTERNFKNLINDKRIHSYLLFERKIIDRVKKGGLATPEELKQQSIKAAYLAAKLKME